MRRCLLFSLFLLSASLSLVPRPAHAEAPVTIFAAASLKGAITDISAAWAKLGHPSFRVSLDSSGTLAKQIQQGAPAQIFISADEKWMDYLAKAVLIEPSTRADLLTNTLVLVRPADHGRPIKLTPGFNLAGILGPSGRLSVGETTTVPAGIYAKQALTKLGLWDYASQHLAPAADVKAALLAVETGEAPAGIVYATDARGDNKIAIIGTFPVNSHDAITYPIAVVAHVVDIETVRSALGFLHSVQARAIYTRYGFGIP